MTSALKSILGFAKQSGAGVAGTTFKYLLYNTASVALNNVVLPLDTEIGGTTPLVRSMVKTGVYAGGGVEFIPRPDTIAMLLTGLLGEDADPPTAVPSATGAYKHTIAFKSADAFDVPYYTTVHAPGGMWADQLLDCRVSALGFSWRAANFLRATMGLAGGTPTKITVPTGIDPDDGPQFLTVLSEIEVPTATPLKVLSGSFVGGNAIPLDEQWIVGSYSPDAFDVVTRAFSLSFVVKITDATLYSKMMYDPAGGSAWAADLFKEADINLKFQSNKEVGTGTPVPYSITIKGNGGAGDAGNIIWSADPIGVRAGRNVLMNMTGVFLATDTGSPVTVEVVNGQADAY
jgi:hypothetical protein